MTVATENRLPVDWATIIYMGLIHGVALLALLPGNFSWSALGVGFALYWITGGVGVTLGFHRLVSHRSFQTPKWLEYFLILCGTLAAQGGPIEWIGVHRVHHKYSDQGLDPHDSNKGFWWSHMGWMFHVLPEHVDYYRYTKDINTDPVYVFLQKYFIHIQVALGLLLFAIGGWPWVIWGIFVRLVVVFHCTWFVNSATHKFGYRTYESTDGSRNCWWVALLTFGEGWHNNHHAYQFSARHGIKWWEIDVTWMAIRTLQALGLASNVRLADESAKPGS